MRGRSVRLSLVSANFVSGVTPWHTQQGKRRPAHNLRSEQKLEAEKKVNRMMQVVEGTPMGCEWLQQYGNFLRRRYGLGEAGHR
jgi:hypothetical protein